MVSRKTAPPTPIPSQNTTSNDPQPPYPTTPIHDTPERPGEAFSQSLLQSPAFRRSDPEDVQRLGSNPWADRADSGELPPSLRVGAGRKNAEIAGDEEGLPATLRVGQSGTSPRRSQESRRPDTEAAAKPQPSWAAVASEIPKQHSGSSQNLNNPFLRTDNTQQTLHDIESSAAVWGDGKLATPPIEMAATLSLSDRPFSEFSPSYRPTNQYFGSPDTTITTTTTNVVHDVSLPPHASITAGPRSESPELALITGFPPAASEPPSRPRPEERQSTTSIISAGTNRSNSSAGWDPGLDITTFDGFTSRGHGLPGVGEVDEPAHVVQRTFQEQKEWDKKERERRELELAAAAEKAQREEQERRAEEEWHRGEAEAQRRAELERRNRAGERSNMEVGSGAGTSVPIGGGTSHASKAATPSTSATREQVQAPKGTSETYQIKQINWFDPKSPKNPRQSPVLVQNANGPCPLLALVNALTLSTPANVETALVETLRVREQVSLGLLLDAVFDELMSGRRGDAAQELPDVSELYAFLVTLHTGMNVNPRFVPPPPKAPNLMDADPVLPVPEIHPADHEAEPGIFESTREMRLYSAFSVPLIHGWIPPRDHPAFTSLERSAKTYEDAQNLLFREEELVEKFERVGLTPEEQLLVDDIDIIKDYLLQSATQLTSFGLETMTRSLTPGEIAILFRNDHFSTLYKHPRSERLLTLVTDMGYAGHPEVVWESLVDVNGEGAEFFSGDIRPVGHAMGNNNQGTRGSSGGQRVRSLLDDNEGWTTVERRGPQRGGNRARPGETGATNASDSVVGSIGDRLDLDGIPSSRPLGSNTEQEDHDLALALQLQEEEEDRHRREVAQRQREDTLSRQFLSGQPRPNATSAQSQQGTRARQQEVRPLIPPRRAVATDNDGGGIDLPPPTYEQAAKSAPYNPPLSPNPTRRSTASSSSREPSAYAAQQSSMSQLSSPPRSRGSRAGHMRAQTHNLIGDVQSPAVVGMRRRSSAGHQVPPAATAQEVEAGKKDCIVM
ncbi:hypothetical protein GP486_006357 [Trichoglossum hirsutum]|uniref:MINDY deubiquitinase domain-containing protein n=1 Tax=Trichoglossum hirsutum TaxID=265104 RepID=A0A9P8IHE3_9PEZI|nr:hypothetical protein GP486_006357 [Trichoglossum hirsutum]